MAKLFAQEIRTDEAAQTRVREWVAALRSGKYAQGKSRLRIDDNFCCLGVACDLQRDTLGPFRKTEDDLTWFVLATDDEGEPYRERFALPDNARALYRLDSPEGHYSHGSLAGHNDDGWTFAEIADIIERELAEAIA